MEQRFYLERFVNAQNDGTSGATYERALSEIRRGGKSSHWIWYVFPQIAGIPGGHSRNTLFFGVKNMAEAKAYAEHPVLGARLKEITQALLDLQGRSITSIMGSMIDAKKLSSSMTLFYYATGEPLYKEVIDRYFFGNFDHHTHRILSQQTNS